MNDKLQAPTTMTLQRGSSYRDGNEVNEQPQSVRLLADTADAITRAMQQAIPAEGCGLLGGTWGSATTITTFIPLENRSTNNRRFDADPLAFLEARARLQADGLQVLGFVHSHPNGTPNPSRRDAELAFKVT